jgi:hypothetical protein
LALAWLALSVRRASSRASPLRRLALAWLALSVRRASSRASPPLQLPLTDGRDRRLGRERWTTADVEGKWQTETRTSGQKAMRRASLHAADVQVRVLVYVRLKSAPARTSFRSAFSAL